MKYPTIFHLVAAEFDKAQIPFILIGGFAINYYKATRQTGDIDFLIAKEDCSKASRILEKAGYKRGDFQKAFVRFQGNQFPLMDVDLMLVDKATLEGIIQEAKDVKIVGKRFLIPSLNHLIAMKLHAIKFNPKNRLLKDLPDIVRLIKINKIDVHTQQFRNLCLKYGTKELYDRILEFVSGGL